VITVKATALFRGGKERGGKGNQNLVTGKKKRREPTASDLQGQGWGKGDHFLTILCREKEGEEGGGTSAPQYRQPGGGGKKKGGYAISTTWFFVLWGAYKKGGFLVI